MAVGVREGGAFCPSLVFIVMESNVLGTLKQTHDPILNFGKHRGTSLSEIPADYLGWLAKHTPPIIMGTRNWSDRAKAEKVRRDNNLPIEASLPFEDETQYPGQPAVSAALEEAPEKKGAKVFRYRSEALDDLSLCLLKTFVLRSDKTIPIRAWTLQMAEEAVKYGKMSDEHFQAWVYVDHIFLYEIAGTEYTLMRVTPKSH